MNYSGSENVLEDLKGRVPLAADVGWESQNPRSHIYG